MIGCVTVGTNDLQRAVEFYDQLMAVIGATRFLDKDHYVAWSVKPNDPGFSVTKPLNGKTATAGNGVTVSLIMPNPEQVNMFYQKAISLGATDEGKPGLRDGKSYYASYFRDLDGNKINAYCLLNPD
ncbi:MAG: VOC family protein [Pseudomonadales bacterium]|nr:VOC family protein [Pseudomonadales bacterium]